MPATNTVRLPAVHAVDAFTVITETSDRGHARAINAISSALIHRNLDRGAADVCGPQGWILVDGKLVGEGADWEVFEVDYCTRSGYMLRGFNRCTGETFSWGGGGASDRYGFTHARLRDARALPFMRVAGFDVEAA